MSTVEEIATPANSIKFADLCSVLEKMHKKKRQRQEQDKLLANFIYEFKINVAKISGKKNSTFFPVLRLLLPDKERERGAYNLKETKLGELLVKVLSLSKQSPDARSLLRFKSVHNSEESDFAGVAYFVLKNRVSNQDGGLTVGEVNDILDKIASAEVGNKGPILDETFSYAIKSMSAEQIKWFLRIILKDLKLGMGVRRTLQVFHIDAPELFDNCGSLVKVCEELETGDTRPVELGIRMFFPVSPMLSERLDVTRVSQLPPRSYHIENKFDGERFQVHMSEGVFEYFSRRGYSYSDQYGRDCSGGLLTPELKDCFSASVHSFIIDGEMMGWNKHKQCFGSKGMQYDVKKITVHSAHRPCFCAFDILYYNGRALAGPPERGGAPLAERLALLDQLFTDVPGVIMHSKRMPVRSSVDIVDALNKGIEEQEEGIVVKDVDSYYIVNRRNAGWYKIKAEYTESTMSDLDLVVVGADEAEDKSQGRARSFHVAVGDIADADVGPHRWLCVGRVSTGLSHAQRAELCALLEPHWVCARSTPPPPQLLFNKEKPDFWVLPEHSIVLQVRASELIRSTEFATSHTLRFQRVVSPRPDKPVRDAMTLREFNTLVADNELVVKLGTKRVSDDQISGEVKIRKKRTAKELKVAEQFRSKGVTSEVVTPVRSAALRGREVCVLSEDEDCGKAELAGVVESHGGKYVQNVGANTWCCVAGKITYRVQKLISTGELDITTTSWLRSLPPSPRPATLSPLDMLSIKPSTRLALRRHYDSFGDSYTGSVDVDELKKCFNKMDLIEPPVHLTQSEMLELDKELFGDNNPFSFLRPCCVHFMKEDVLRGLKAQAYGAAVCTLHSPKLTHVLANTNDPQEIERVRNTAGVFIVSEKWLEACFAEEKLVGEANYLV